VVDAMRRHYDFSKSVPNPYLAKAKKQLTIRLDEDTIKYFKALAQQNGIPYQNLINLYLRECAESEKKLTMKWQIASKSPL
jgi:predicted DNA binding CopG/RHH family protein